MMYVLIIDIWFYLMYLTICRKRIRGDVYTCWQYKGVSYHYCCVCYLDKCRPIMLLCCLLGCFRLESVKGRQRRWWKASLERVVERQSLWWKNQRLPNWYVITVLCYTCVAAQWKLSEYTKSLILNFKRGQVKKRWPIISDHSSSRCKCLFAGCYLTWCYSHCQSKFL